jgi:predicted nucleotidyltransferase
MAQTKTVEVFTEIQGIVDQIVQRFRPCRIILFGSYASGTPTPDSDVDVLVVMPEPPGWQEAYRAKCELQARFSLRLQLVFMEEQQFEETRNVIGGLAYPASHAGKVLYEQNSSP